MGQSELERKQSDLNPWYLEARSKIYSSSSSTSTATVTAASATGSSIGSAHAPRKRDADWDAKRKRSLDPLADMMRYDEASKKYRDSLTRPSLPSPSTQSSSASRAIGKQEPFASATASSSRAVSSLQSNSTEVPRIAHSDSARSGSRSIEQLRAERMAREAAERSRAEALLSRVNAARAGVPLQYKATSSFAQDEREQRYNSQFNPDIARQNRPREPRDWNSAWFSLWIYYFYFKLIFALFYYHLLYFILEFFHMNIRVY